jgi:hypothetical protein
MLVALQVNMHAVSRSAPSGAIASSALAWIGVIMGAAACSSRSSVGSSNQDVGDAMADHTAVCTMDAWSPGLGALTPDGDAADCPAGWWENRGFACGPFGATCRPSGDGLCYRLCATSDDCPDPCARSCAGMPFFMGGDTPSGAAPVCQPGAVRRLPPTCESEVRVCFSSCHEGSFTPGCAIECWAKARECAADTCKSPYVKCAQHCSDTLPDPDAINACIQECYGAEIECEGPH